MQFRLWRAAAFISTPIHLLSRRDRESGLVHQCRPSVCLSVCLSQKCKKTWSTQKLSNLELWCLLTTYRKSYMSFSKNPLLDPWNPRWLRSAISKIHMTSFFSAVGGPIWIKFQRLMQNDMSTAVMWSKSKPDVEFQYGGRLSFGRIQWHIIPQARITLQGAATWWIHCHDSRATCHIAGCKNSIRHIENRFSPYFNFFLFFACGLGFLTSGGFRIVSDSLVSLCSVCCDV